MCSWARTLDLVHIITAVGWVDISDTLLPFPELPVCFGNAEADPSQYAPSQVVSQRGPGLRKLGLGLTGGFLVTWTLTFSGSHALHL